MKVSFLPPDWVMSSCFCSGWISAITNSSKASPGRPIWCWADRRICFAFGSPNSAFRTFSHPDMKSPPFLPLYHTARREGKGTGHSAHHHRVAQLFDHVGFQHSDYTDCIPIKSRVGAITVGQPPYVTAHTSVPSV